MFVQSVSRLKDVYSAIEKCVGTTGILYRKYHNENLVFYLPMYFLRQKKYEQ